jgi:prolyl-tRNA synthetase
MRWTEYHIPTIKEVPADAEVISHILMMRAGMIRKLSAGIFTYLPLGYRVIRKLENIVREEMNAAGAHEVFLPAIQPAELWMESGRWQLYGKELLRIKDRHGRDYCFGPTHEEVITDLVRHDLTSYRHLPKTFYQIQTKFRDEIRPRFGLMRGREFSMKDAYSFDSSNKGLDESYRKMHDAYCRIFRRCGLRFRLVEADSGAIGGKECHEFMVLAASGEDAVMSCASCGYAANLEKAEVPPPLDQPAPDPNPLPLEKVSTPGMRTIEQVTGFLKVPAEKLVKTLILMADGQPVAALIRGDHELSEVKLKNYIGCDELSMAEAAQIQDLTGGPMGFSGPVGLRENHGVKIFADQAIRSMRDFVTGANENDMHFMHVCLGRDFEAGVFDDFRQAKPDDPCPRCREKLGVARGIEVGHIFKLGTKYSQAMKAVFADEKGEEHPIIMGCYGLGIGRTAAAAIEQNHDEHGIIWPINLAPFEVLLTPVNTQDKAVMEAADRLYGLLQAEKIETLYDDRGERPGVKFNDADLIGVPYRLTLGTKSIKEGVIEIFDRRTRQTEKVGREKTVARLKEVLDQAKRLLNA